MLDQLFRRVLYLVHVASFLLDRVSVSILLDWNGRWRHSRVARLGADSLGKPTRRTFLYSEPLARFHHWIRDRRTCCLRLEARSEPRHQRSWPSRLARRALPD